MYHRPELNRSHLVGSQVCSHYTTMTCVCVCVCVFGCPESNRGLSSESALCCPYTTVEESGLSDLNQGQTGLQPVALPLS